MAVEGTPDTPPTAERKAPGPPPIPRMNALLQFTERFGSMLSRVLLFVLYYVLLGPFALVYRAVADPLHVRRRASGNWSTWVSANDTLPAARRQD